MADGESRVVSFCLLRVWFGASVKRPSLGRELLPWILEDPRILHAAVLTEGDCCPPFQEEGINILAWLCLLEGFPSATNNS